MKKRALWLILSCLMVVALVLSSCAPNVEPTPTTPAPTTPIPTTPAPAPITPTPTTPAPAPETEVPKYGGTLIDAFPIPHDSLDCYSVTGYTAYTLHMTNEQLLTGDWTRGPAGTNEYDWWIIFQPAEFEVGCLAESWDIPDESTIVFHIRKGVHYGLNPQSEASRLANGREMTAEDVAFCIQRKWTPPGYFGVSKKGWFQSATATDKYTVVVKFNSSVPGFGGTARVFEYVSEYENIYPPEIIAKYGSMKDWSVSCGTGPFFFVDYVPGSSYTFARNPNYWMKDPIGLGKGNQLPYLDQVKWLLIPDKSTRIAALRTAKVDHLGGSKDNLTLNDKESLLKTNPQLKWRAGLCPKPWSLYGRMDKPELPFKDIRVRQALQMAIDCKKIKDEYYGGQAEIITLPVSSVFKDIYTPLEELPESTREIYTYNPEKAKKLLAEAGYPNGFKTTVLCYDAGVDLMSIVKDYWAKIGVDAKIDLREWSIYNRIRVARTHEEMVIYESGLGSASYAHSITDPSNQGNLCMVNDPYCNERFDQIWALENIGKEAKRAQLMKEYTLHFLTQVYAIQVPDPYVYNIWQPWVKNYHGENSISYADEPNWAKYTWLDQDLKKQMTGRK